MTPAESRNGRIGREFVEGLGQLLLDGLARDACLDLDLAGTGFVDLGLETLDLLGRAGGGLLGQGRGFFGHLVVLLPFLGHELLIRVNRGAAARAIRCRPATLGHPF